MRPVIILFRLGLLYGQRSLTFILTLRNSSSNVFDIFSGPETRSEGRTTTHPVSCSHGPASVYVPVPTKGRSSTEVYVVGRDLLSYSMYKFIDCDKNKLVRTISQSICHNWKIVLNLDSHIGVDICVLLCVTKVYYTFHCSGT